MTVSSFTQPPLARRLLAEVVGPTPTGAVAAPACERSVPPEISSGAHLSPRSPADWSGSTTRPHQPGPAPRRADRLFKAVPERLFGFVHNAGQPIGVREIRDDIRHASPHGCATPR